MCCVGSVPCDELITGTEESYRVCVCVSNCVWSRNLKTRQARLLDHSKKFYYTCCTKYTGGNMNTIVRIAINSSLFKLNLMLPTRTLNFAGGTPHHIKDSRDLVLI